ncbi:MAG: twin-arginine translocation signal domain-containing protein [Phycisphaerae bacterium]|nr:twin-arginine translocation signal domain-containing protein [Phycisphaerae bacterium]
MQNEFSRRGFLGAAAAAGLGLGLSASRVAAQDRPRVEVCNPLLRTPLSLIIDDSCPVINKAYYWIQQRHDWRLKHEPNSPPSGWEVHYDRLGSMPNAIPAAFAAQWGDWCGAQGIRGKFSMVPFPAGVGRIDQGFPGFPPQELKDWLRVTKEIIWKNFDLTPEMLTHTHVVDLKTWKLTEQWEQGEWVDPPVDQLTEYIVAAMQLLKNVGIACEGVTSPGAFGKRKEMAHARAVLDAALQVNNNPRPFYFLNMEMEEMPTVPIRHADKAKGEAVASIIGCAGDWFGATGYDESNPDLFITADLQGGRLPAVLAKERPTILVGHWPCFYVNGQIGFKVLKEVKKRLDAYDPDKSKTIWMKNSEIGHYWMARELSDLSVTDGAGGPGRTIRIATKFPTDNFTLAIHGCTARRLQVGGTDLRQVQSQRDLGSGTFLATDKDTFVAFDLKAGDTTLSVSA